MPWSLHSMADVRAARTGEKIGHSGRDDNAKPRETQEHRQECLCHKCGLRGWQSALPPGFAEEFGGG